RCVLIGSVFLAIRSGLAGPSPPVQVRLQSSWAAPPFALEAIETISEHHPDAFFPLIHAITTEDALSKLHKSVPSEVYQLILDTAIHQGYLADTDINTVAGFKMGLGLHTATPKIEAFYQYYLDRHSSRDGAECGSWVDWYGQVVCDVETLAHLAGVETIDSSAGHEVCFRSFNPPKLLPFDHVQPLATHLSRPPRTAILYASLASPNFRSLHDYLYKASTGSSPHIEYVLRHIPGRDRDLSSRSYLSGYGVALDLKKMEYLAIDDRSSESTNTKSETASTVQSDPIITLLHQYPENSSADYTTALTKDELLRIGLQAVQLIRDSTGQDLEEPSSATSRDSLNALATLKQLSQNFLKYASALARRVAVDQGLEDEVFQNGMKVQGGASACWLNGVVVQEKDMNPFTLLRFMRKERGIMLSLMKQGLTSEQAISLLTHKTVGAAQSESGTLDGLFDASDRPEGGDLIMWWNDFEKDARYARWGDNINILLRQMYPGQFPSLRRNIFNVVLSVDLSQSSSLSFIGATVANIITRQFPFRFGVVPIVETEGGLQMARLFYWLIENVGRARTMQFIQRIAQITAPPHELTYHVQWPLVRSEFKSLISSLTSEDLQTTSLPLDTLKQTVIDDVVLGRAEGALESKITQAKEYAKRLGLDLESASQGSAFVNGKWYELNDDFLRNMQTELGEHMQILQEELYSGTLSEEKVQSISTYFYDLPTSLQRRNKHIFPSKKTGSLKILSLPDLYARTGLPISNGAFVYPVAEEDDDVPITVYVIADLDSQSGKKLVREALLSLAATNGTRLTFIHNPSVDQDGLGPVSTILGQLVANDALSKFSPSRLLGSLKLEDVAASVNEDEQVVLQAQDNLLEGLTQSGAPFLSASHAVVHDLQLKPGQQALIVNGRIVGPFHDGDFIAEDIQALASYEYRKRVQPVVEALNNVLGSFETYTRESLSTLISAASSIVSSIRLPDPSEAGLFNTPQRPRLRNYQLLGNDYTKYEFGKNETALLHFGFVLDPLSETAQKWSSIIEWLLNDPSVFVELHINPARYRDLPLKRFYRYNLPGELTFDEHGSEVQSLAIFSELPIEPIYTLAMDVPQSWLVRPREAQYDLDNIQLGVVPAKERAQGVQATFNLDYLVIEGHAREPATMAPPRGLQLQLVTSGTQKDNATSVAIADTQVVANLGYLQFRVKPGVFKLEIRPGRGRDIFIIESVGNEGWESPDVDAVGDEVTLTNFEGLTLYPRFKRVRGMELVDVLAVEEKSAEESKGFLGDVLSGFSSMFSSKPTPTTDLVPADNHAEINIFTVASGLLYERFASIMILSVLRNTNSTVKFWFIENFLSPSFLEFIPHFAKAYNFKYELVTYKWPSWLRAQKEKQRIIWAYKILFLDVLFPMDLKKVIFVDADQIVRADLKELVDLDLHGAPYGYTPMGDDNTDMEGFRFWKTGYWKDFLQGMPYHISALYVVDLVRFRQMAAGDMLRGHYQQLSADPNSLANLDQDLPNNLQREVPIFSLPEDWLWCETWCSKDRLHRAKTIDLCQNPLTKEPKLVRARQIPEWSTYDSEIAEFARQLAERGEIHSGIAAADANVLAAQAAGVVKPADDITPVAKDQDKADHVRDEL
ncbi:glycosyltransferase family 24 protein, partial [Cristinia sonorae]